MKDTGAVETKVSAVFFIVRVCYASGMNPNPNPMKTVVILGASDKVERYSNKAQKLLMEHGYAVVPVHPTLGMTEGVPVVHSLREVPRNPDVLTVYVRLETSSELGEEILLLLPKAVIFNPGTENPELERKLEEARIRVVRACTIMLFSTGRFERVMFPEPSV